jgi:hypothetical protein
MEGIVNRAFRGFSLEPAFSEGKHARQAKNYIFIKASGRSKWAAGNRFPVSFESPRRLRPSGADPPPRRG